MSETITLHALDLSGETTLKLFLRKDDGTLLNTGGADLAEISSSGVFTATLAESRSGLGVLNARVCLGTETADNLVWDGSLPEGSTVLGATVRAELDSSSLRSALGMSAADLDAQLDAILAAGDIDGAHVLTITVTDDDTSLPIEGAKVRIFRTGADGTGRTNASGVATMGRDSATWTVTVSAASYVTLVTSVVVSADASISYELTASSITPPTNPALSAIEVLCLDEDFQAASGIDIDFRLAAVASGDQNRAHPGAKKTVTSNVSGIARFEGPQGATIEYKRGTGQVWTSVVLDNDSVTNVTSVIGSP